jgi:hypothetical protein
MWDQAALTKHLSAIDDAVVIMTFSEIDDVVGELPDSARTWPAYWANSRKSRPHSRAWLDAGRLASPDFVMGVVRFTLGSPRSDTGGGQQRSQARTLSPEPNLQPTGESYRGEVLYAWVGGGQVTLASGRLVMPALGVAPGVYRFTLVEPKGDVRSYYVGEAANLFQRMNGYRNPGSSQATNLRMNPKLCELLADGGTVPVDVVLEASLDGVALDLKRKPARLIVENTALEHLAIQGATVENLRTRA